MPQVHRIAPGASFYRVTPAKYKTAEWKRKVLGGRGAFHTRHGGRYNHPGTQAAYLADEPAAAVAEGGYYAACEWLDERFPNHFFGRPVGGPLASAARKL